jgi:hypothetical protein
MATQTFNPCTPADLQTYIDQYIRVNHNNEITGEQHNNVETGLLAFILASYRNYNRATVISTASSYSATCNQCILIFKSGATGSINLTNNRWNEWVIYNNSGDEKQFVGSIISQYRTQGGIVKNYVDSGQVLHLAKGNDNIWYEIDNGAAQGSGALPPLIGVVGDGGDDDPVAGESTFQNDKLIGLGATNSDRIQIVYAENIMSNFGDNSSFVFDNALGIIDISPQTFVTGSSLYVNRNQ